MKDCFHRYNFKDYNVSVDILDPWADKDEVFNEYGIKVYNNVPNKKYHGIVLAVSHKNFLKINIKDISYKKTVIFDIKSFFKDTKDRIIHRL